MCATGVIYCLVSLNINTYLGNSLLSPNRNSSPVVSSAGRSFVLSIIKLTGLLDFDCSVDFKVEMVI
jgi:hypothetical protein